MSAFLLERDLLVGDLLDPPWTLRFFTSTLPLASLGVVLYLVSAECNDTLSNYRIQTEESPVTYFFCSSTRQTPVLLILCVYACKFSLGFFTCLRPAGFKQPVVIVRKRSRFCDQDSFWNGLSISSCKLHKMAGVRLCYFLRKKNSRKTADLLTCKFEFVMDIPETTVKNGLTCG